MESKNKNKKCSKTEVVNNSNLIELNNQYAISVDQLNADESFNCPKCKALISPDDETAGSYEILEPKMDDKGVNLSGLVIKCGTCGTIVILD